MSYLPAYTANYLSLYIDAEGDIVITMAPLSMALNLGQMSTENLPVVGATVEAFEATLSMGTMTVYPSPAISAMETFGATLTLSEMTFSNADFIVGTGGIPIEIGITVQ